MQTDEEERSHQKRSPPGQLCGCTLAVFLLETMTMMMEVGYLDRVHGCEHHQAQGEEKAILNSPRQTERIMLGIVGLSQPGEEKVKGTRQTGPPPATPISGGIAFCVPATHPRLG